MYYSLQLEHTFARPWAAGLASDPTLARVATHSTVAAELLFLPLVFLPVVRRLGRPVAVTVAAGLHLSIIAFMNVGNFPGIMLARLIPFVPAGAIDRVFTRLSAAAWRSGAARDRARTSVDPRAGSVAATADGWLRIPAVLASGSTVDLVTGRALSDEPLRADPLYSRWTKVTEWIAAARNAEYRLEYSRMYCRLRNLHLRPGESIVSFDLIYTQRRIPPPGQSAPPLRPILLGSHRC